MKKDSIVIVQYPIDRLKAADYNPRAQTDEAYVGLKESLTKFGFVEPIVVNLESGNIVGGHQRVRAAADLGLPTVPVVEVRLNDAQEKALNVTLNNQKISGFFTNDLQDLLFEIKGDLGEEFLEDLNLDALIDGGDSWDSDIGAMDSIEENLDGIKSVIKVKCPPEIKDEVLIYLKSKFLEVSFEGVEVV